MSNKEVVIIYSSYTPSMKKAIHNYKNKNKEKIAEYNRNYNYEKYHNTEAYRTLLIEYNKKKYQEKRQEILQLKKDRYHTDPEYREKILQNNRLQHRKRKQQQEFNPPS